jgi:sigma-B regulation protein RsbU (phosphoserine phosphatase)
MSIYIVDDNPINLTIIEQMLRKAGYHDILKSTTVGELFDYLHMSEEIPSESSVDLILMDLMMLEVDGIEATRRIQQVDGLRDIPIIIVTALGDSQKLAEALDVGAIDYVMKPVNKIELLARIRVALRLKFEKDWHKEQDNRMRTELNLAKEVQMSILSAPLNDSHIKISATYRPSSELAGDLYAWNKIDEHRYGIILLDVMGHGISSSLVGMYISSVLKDTIINFVDPIEVITELNHRMNRLDIKDPFIQYYFTAIYLMIDTQKGEIEYINAGHPPGFVQANDQLYELTDGCCAVGLFPEMNMKKGLIQYDTAMNIFLYTDGLLEQMKVHDEKGMDQVVDLWLSSDKLEADELYDKCMSNEIHEFQEDDICMILIHALRHPHSGSN